MTANAGNGKSRSLCLPIREERSAAESLSRLGWTEVRPGAGGLNRKQKDSRSKSTRLGTVRAIEEGHECVQTEWNRGLAVSVRQAFLFRF